MRRALGLAVFSGMVGVTVFGVLLTPVFFYVIQRLGDAPFFHTVRGLRVGFGLYVGLNIALLGLPILLQQLMGPTRHRQIPHAPALPPPPPRKSGVRSQESGIRNQKPKDRDQKPGDRGQNSEGTTQ
jgi:hypothetical protein